MEEEVFSCDHCDTQDLSVDDITLCEGDEVICQDCVDVGKADYCNSCDNWVYDKYSEFIDARSWPGQRIRVCGYCSDDYYSCSSCGVFFHCDDILWHEPHDEYYCEECYPSADAESLPNIRDWGDDPELEFVTFENGFVETDIFPANNTYYMGIEIELEDAATTINDTIHMFPFLWAKTDSSLGRAGVEVVSMPATLEAWNNDGVIDWSRWDREVHQSVRNDGQYGSNGIHIHVSRSAFLKANGRRSASHLYRFMQFIQNHESTIQQFAGRTGNEYCYWNMADDMVERIDNALKPGSGDRYRPINVQNADTIELRFFDGRSEPDFILAALQFVHAVVEYTRTLSIKSKVSWSAFVRWVSTRNEYAMLYSRLTANRDTYYQRSVDDERFVKERKIVAKERRIAQAQLRRARIREEQARRQFRSSYRCPCGMEH